MTPSTGTITHDYSENSHIPPACEHKYVYLRQERRNDRHILFVVDVFYCEKCLTYREHIVKEFRQW